MKHKGLIFQLIVGLSLLIGGCGVYRVPHQNLPEVVVLYDNDVHCSVDGYSAMAALKKKQQEQTPWVTVVSCGDFVSGSVLGTMSYGENIIRLMNDVGYDYVTLGNHEFDFAMSRLRSNMDLLRAQVLCCNFRSIESDTSIYSGGEIRDYGGVKVGFLGVTTPTAMTTSSSSYFKNSAGEFIYSFGGERLGVLVQHTVDSLRSEGAQYIVALCHLGDEDAPRLISETQGIDVVLDGHSHSTIPHRKVKNRLGRDVLWSSTGSAFHNIGRLVISADTIISELLPLDAIQERDSMVGSHIVNIKKQFENYAGRTLGVSEISLLANHDHDNRPVRRRETNLGDFCADAMRIVMGTQIAVINGGSFRSNLSAGELTFGSLYSVFPFNNAMCVGTITGQDLLDALEMASRKCPNDNGGFMQVSGMRYSIDTSTPSSVELDNHDLFVRVAGPRRVYGVEILGEDGLYHPIALDERYTVASSEYVLKNCGDGIVYPSFVESNDGPIGVCSDVEVLERYLVDCLKGKIPDCYQSPQGRITISADR